jgi:hypothetical protein
MSFLSNGAKFKLYTVLNALIFPRPTQPRISFERAIEYHQKFSIYNKVFWKKIDPSIFEIIENFVFI